MPPLQAVEALNGTFAVVDSTIEIAQVSRIIELFANSTEIVENENVSYLEVNRMGMDRTSGNIALT